MASRRLRSPPQDQTVVATLLKRPQRDRLAVLVGDLEAERVDIEGTARLQVANAILDVTETNDVERWIQIVRWNGHVGPSASSGRQPASLAIGWEEVAKQTFLVSM